MTNAFADAGIDVIAEQLDSPITIAQTAEKRGVFVIGKDVNIKERAPNAWLTGVSWNWGSMMKTQIEQILADEWKPSHVRGSLASGAAVLDPFGDAVPVDVQEKVMTMKAQILDGKQNIWTGPIFKQDGTEVVAAGAVPTMEQVETTDFLVKGVIDATQ